MNNPHSIWMQARCARPRISGIVESPECTTDFRAHRTCRTGLYCHRSRCVCVFYWRACVNKYSSYLGEKVPVDVIIYGTGFVTVRTILLGQQHSDSRQDNYPMNLHGPGGTLKEYNDAHGGPQAYLGTTVPGFPNFFMMQGMLLPWLLILPFYFNNDPASRWNRSKHDHWPHIRHLLGRIPSPTHPRSPRTRARRNTYERISKGLSDGQVQRHAARPARRYSLVAVRIMVPRRRTRSHFQYFPRTAFPALVLAAKAPLGGLRDRRSWREGMALPSGVVTFGAACDSRFGWGSRNSGVRFKGQQR